MAAESSARDIDDASIVSASSPGEKPTLDYKAPKLPDGEQVTDECLLPDSGTGTKDITFHAKTMSGDTASISISAKCLVGDLKAALYAQLGIKPMTVILANNDVLGPDNVALDSFQCVSEESECLHQQGLQVTVVALSMIKVTRHIYKARFGGPSQRGSFLTSTEEIELDPSAKLGEQMHKIVPDDGTGKGSGKGRGRTFIWHSEAAPAKWGERQGENDSAPDAEPELFGADCEQTPEIFANGGKSIVVLIPMGGTD